MKTFIGGLILGVASTTIIALILNLVNIGSPEHSRGVVTKESKYGSLGTFDVFHEGEYIFTYSAFSNGYNIRRYEPDLMSPRFYFSNTEQFDRGTLYDLSTSRRLEDGSEKSVRYDMESGEIETTIITDENGVRGYDSEGKLIEPDNQSEDVNGVTRHSLETLNQRREELSEKLRNYEPENNEQN